MTIRRGEFFGVVGSVGSGKTTFLQAILGEMRKTGTLNIKEKGFGNG